MILKYFFYVNIFNNKKCFTQKKSRQEINRFVLLLYLFVCGAYESEVLGPDNNTTTYLYFLAHRKKRFVETEYG